MVFAFVACNRRGWLALPCLLPEMIWVVFEIFEFKRMTLVVVHFLHTGVTMYEMVFESLSHLGEDYKACAYIVVCVMLVLLSAACIIKDSNYRVGICGVSVNFLKELLNDLPSETISTEDYCVNIVKGQTASRKCSYVRFLRATACYNIRSANVYVCHAWKGNFKDMLETVIANTRADDFVWIDVFSINQHSNTIRPNNQQLKKLLHNTVETTLVVLDSYSRPLCLTRSWCLLEMYWGKNVEFALHPSQRKLFETQLLEMPDMMCKSLTDVYFEQSNTTNPDDKVCIQQTINNPIAPKITNKLRRWLGKTGERVLTDNNTPTSSLAHFCANVAHERGDLDKAYELCTLALDKYGTEQSMRVIECWTTAFEVLCDLDQIEKARVIHKRTTDMEIELWKNQEHILGPEQLDMLAVTYENRGVIFRDQEKNFTAALEIQMKALDIKQRLYGLNHTKVADCYVGLATTHTTIGNHEEAIRFLTEALIIYTIRNGMMHVTVSNTKTSLAEEFGRVGQYDKALRLYTEDRKCAISVLGHAHEDIGTSYTRIGRTLCFLGKFDAADLVLQKGYTILINALGASHPKTLLCDALRHVVHTCLGRESWDDKHYSAIVDAVENQEWLSHPDVQFLKHLIRKMQDNNYKSWDVIHGNEKKDQ